MREIKSGVGCTAAITFTARMYRIVCIAEVVYRRDMGQHVYEEYRTNSCHMSKVLACGGLVSFVEEKTLGEEYCFPDAASGHAIAINLYSGQSLST